MDGVQIGAGLGTGVDTEILFGVVAGQAERHDPDGRQAGVPGKDLCRRPVERGAIVDAGTEHDLSVHGNPMVQERPEPSQRRRSPRVPQHSCSHRGVGGVDRDVERAEALLNDASKVQFSEAGQRREVSVEEREAVVVVLEVQRLAHPRGKLIDETELAMVVAGLDPIEDRRRESDAQGLTGDLVETNGPVPAFSTDRDFGVRVVDELLVLDHVGRDDPVHGDEFITNRQPRLSGRAVANDLDHGGIGHRCRWYPSVLQTRHPLCSLE